jgi:hypothetical protein
MFVTPEQQAARRILSGGLIRKKDVKTYDGLSNTTFRRYCREIGLGGDRSHFWDQKQFQIWVNQFGPVKI